MLSRPIILSRQAFQQYLESCDNKIAGQKCDSEDCPIARHLKLEFPEINHLTVDDDIIMYEDNDIYRGFISIPYWAQTFIHDIDESESPATGRYCLAILDSIDPRDNESGELIDPTE